MRREWFVEDIFLLYEDEDGDVDENGMNHSFLLQKFIIMEMEVCVVLMDIAGVS